MNDIKPKLMGELVRLTTVNNIVKEIEYMMLLQSPCVFWLNQLGTLAATATYILSKETARRKNMNKKVLKVGNLSTGNSQAGTIYRTWGGLSPTLCAGTHGYALGYIVVNKKKASKKQMKCRRNEL